VHIFRCNLVRVRAQDLLVGSCRYRLMIISREIYLRIIEVRLAILEVVEGELS